MTKSVLFRGSLAGLFLGPGLYLDAGQLLNLDGLDLGGLDPGELLRDFASCRPQAVVLAADAGLRQPPPSALYSANWIRISRRSTLPRTLLPRVVPFHGVMPVKQSFIGRHERRTVHQRGSNDETVGRVIMQSGKVECAHCYGPVERQLDRPQRRLGQRHRRP